MRYFRPKFDAGQRIELSRLGLEPAQIDAVQEAMRAGLSALVHEDTKPAVQDVAAEFERLSTALRRASDALSDLARADDEEPTQAARAEVRTRCDIASHKLTGTLGDDGPLMKALWMLAQCNAVVARARKTAPTEPTRRMSASPFPIKLIHDALKGATPPSNIRASASPTAPFRRVVQVCYAAMKRPNGDPDRAIKAYVSWLKKEQNAARLSDVPS
ncbi:MAG: hypothetical protein C0505_18845 [Leptothrix sp. (in: Bacteria)]|nr:hypothetical protein [Leptothrix sp. (in: b-proteobacteria)]